MKILLIDIETAPNLGYTWGKYEQNVLSYVKEWYVLSFAYKWLGEKRTKVCSLPEYRGYRKDPTNDLSLVREAHSILNQANAAIAHNGDFFDLKKLNARFIYHRMEPLHPLKTIDTLKIARRHFSFNSNSLKDLAEYLGVKRKMDAGGFELWKGCLAGDRKSWRKMVEYNRRDVEVLECVYQRLLPWVLNHPNYNVYNLTRNDCPRCGSNKVIRRGFRVSKTATYQAFFCKDCRSYSQSKKPVTKSLVQVV